MCRIAYIVLVLAALVATSANASPVHPAKTRNSAPASSHSHRKQHSTAAHAQPRANQRASEPQRVAGKVSKPPTLRRRLRSRRVAESASPSVPPVVLTASIDRSFAPMPPPLRGSQESLIHQNQMADAEGLERIEDEDDLAARIQQKLLVPVPVSAAMTISASLPENHRYCRTWTADFLADLARQHAAAFQRPLEVTSAVRTIEYQKRLMGTNGNAASAEGDVVSPHLTGATIDIAKQGMSRQEIAWMRNWLLAQQEAGKIDVEEEFQQSCFHISVYKTYEPVPPAPAPAQQKAASRKVFKPIPPPPLPPQVKLALPTPGSPA
jgi:uncharacterized protein YcbK (DUF882 family)